METVVVVSLEERKEATRIRDNSTASLAVNGLG